MVLVLLCCCVVVVVDLLDAETRERRESHDRAVHIPRGELDERNGFPAGEPAI